MKIKVVLILLFITGSIGLLVGIGLGDYFNGQQSEEIQETPLHTVSTYQVRTRLVPEKIILSGEFVAAHRIQLAPRSSGRLIRVAVGPGDRVEANVELARLDAPELEQTLQRTQAELRNAQSEQKDAKADLKHLKTLAKKQLASDDALRNARTRLERANAAVNAAKTVVQNSKSDLEELILRAPEAIIVVRRLKEPGDLAGPLLPIVEAEAASGLRFDAWVPVSDSHQLQIGMPVEIRIGSSASSTTGHISRIAQSADPVTRSRKVEVLLPEYGKYLSGQYGEAHITVGDISLPMLPVSALIHRAGITGVFIVDDESKTRYRSIRTGRRVDDQIEVLAGVKLDERVVVNPVTNINDGDLVEIVTP